jgi:hypothetical protein
MTRDEIAYAAEQVRQQLRQRTLNLKRGLKNTTPPKQTPNSKNND